MEIKKTNAMWVVRKITDYFTMAFMGGMASVVIMATLSRYVLKIPIFWAEELARLFMIWMCFLGAAIAMRQHGHVRASFVVLLLPEKMQKIIGLLARVVVAIFLVMIIRYSLDLLPKVYLQISSTLRVPMAFAYASVPVGAFVILIEVIAVAIQEARSKT